MKTNRRILGGTAGLMAFRRILGLAPIMLSLLMGCGAGEPLPPAEQAKVDSSTQLLLMGQRFSSLGQSVRAEQYFLAAIEAGAKREEVEALLIDTCVRSGRLRSALHYVERALRRQGEDDSLRRLAASIYMSIGQRSSAIEQAEHLAESKVQSTGTLLFLGEFYERFEQRREVSARFYEQYLERVDEDEEEKWVRPALRALRGREKELGTLVADKREVVGHE